MGVKLCFILREERRLRVFQDRVLRKIFGPQRNRGLDEIISCDYISVLLTKYYLGDHIKKNKIGRVCGRYGERRGAYGGLVWEF